MLLVKPSVDRVREHIWIVSMLLTGHNIFKYHLFNMGITEKKSCRSREVANMHIL